MTFNEILFILAVGVSAFSIRCQKRMEGPSVKRGETSLAVLAGIFAAFFGLAVAIITSTVEKHTSFYLVFFFILIGYLCFYNECFRDWIYKERSKVATLESDNREEKD